jgi:hypothetical protein
LFDVVRHDGRACSASITPLALVIDGKKFRVDPRTSARSSRGCRPGGRRLAPVTMRAVGAAIRSGPRRRTFGQALILLAEARCPTAALLGQHSAAAWTIGTAPVLGFLGASLYMLRRCDDRLGGKHPARNRRALPIISPTTSPRPHGPGYAATATAVEFSAITARRSAASAC